MPAFSGTDIRAALQELSNELGERERVGQIYLVGGAAMALTFRTDRVTHDLDALFVDSRKDIIDCVKAIAKRHEDWHDDWLNEGVKEVLSSVTDRAATPVFETPYLKVLSASAEFLLAMKLRSGRTADMGDISALLRVLKIEKADEALKIYGHVFPHEYLDAGRRKAIEMMVVGVLPHRGISSGHSRT